MRLLSMSGFIPEEICDIVRFSTFSGNRNISLYCGYASDFIDCLLSDDSFDGGVFPHTCDSSRIIKSYLGDCGKFIYQLNVPIRRDRAAAAYFANIIKEYKSAVEKHFGINISNAVIAERADMINKRNNALKKIYDNIDVLNYSDYLKMIHNMLKQTLPEQTVSNVRPTSLNGGKRVMLVGSFLSNIELTELIEKNGMKIAADDIPESGRLVSRKRVSGTGEIYDEISQAIIGSALSPTQNDFADILDKDLKTIRNKDISAVIFVTQKYCEPYDYLYSVFKKMLDDNNIPSLKLSVTDSQSAGNAELMIETFANMIGG